MPNGSAKTGEFYRLPTEAEWEYACRAGTTTPYFFGADTSKLGDYAWYGANSGGKYAKVATKKPNAWGLYDMLGNAWQWTEDCYHDSYKGAPSDGSAWTAGGCTARVSRGGSWSSLRDQLRAGQRDQAPAGARFDDYGFRVARTLN